MSQDLNLTRILCIGPQHNRILKKKKKHKIEKHGSGPNSDIKADSNRRKDPNLKGDLND